MENFKKININYKKTVHCNAYKKIFSCAPLLCTYEEKIKIQTTGIYNKHTEILKTNFLK